jgi:transglutaminase-like putative cysteine protease
VHAWRVTRNGRRDLPSLVDGLGNVVHCHTIREPHTAYTIVATGEVETADTNGIVRGAPEPLPPIFFLRTTPLTAGDPAIESFAAEAVRGSSVADRLFTLMHVVRDRLDYRTGSTDVETTAAEALARGAGVCQDHAHLFIATARCMGIPARYVSGYLWTGLDLHESEASHAWVEAFVPEIGWMSFDPSNRTCPSGGLDYWSAAPVRGIRQGDAPEGLEVAVQVQQDAAEQ